ncbi:unnamed protein product [Allacma fusca]|uniref:Uncharacterized protein n=1 Tax=Allacma fusca TaxID=39272 RepID=A0A8J2MA82_9HEXA|nr:unnamed protein product [Allacma fusca]
MSGVTVSTTRIDYLMAPKCPALPSSTPTAEASDTESVLVRLLFEAVGTLLLIVTIRVIRYLTHQAAPGTCLERWIANIDFSPSDFITSRMIQVQTVSRPTENPHLPQLHTGVIATIDGSHHQLEQVCVYS